MKFEPASLSCTICTDTTKCNGKAFCPGGYKWNVDHCEQKTQDLCPPAMAFDMMNLMCVACDSTTGMASMNMGPADCPYPMIMDFTTNVCIMPTMDSAGNMM
jgi:hypothetical protein